MQILLDNGARIDFSDAQQRTALSYAAEARQTDVVSLLLQRGADAGIAGSNGQTPLSHAASSGHSEIVRALLERGAVPDSADDDHESPLSHAARWGHVEVVQALLQRGADVDSTDRFGRSPISYAADNGYDRVVQILLDNGARADDEDEDCRTPLSHAVEGGAMDVVKLLLPRTSDPDRGSTLNFAVDDESLVRLLLDNGASPYSEQYGTGDYCPLACAAQAGHGDVLRMLLASSTADDEPIKRKQCESALLCAVMDEVASTIEILLEQGIFPHREGSSETAVENALNLARISGDRDVMSLLESHIEHLD